MYLRQRHPFPVFSIVKKISNFLFARTKWLKGGCSTTLRYLCRKLFAPSYECIFMLLCVHRVFCDSHCQLLYFSCSSCCPPIAVWWTCVGFPLNRKKCSYLTSLLSYPDNVQNFFFLEQDGYCYLLLQHYSIWRVLLKLLFPKSCSLNCTRN